MVDPRLLQPVAALREIVQARLDRPPGLAAGKRQARRAARLIEPDRREQPLFAAQRVEHRARHDMGMGIDDHRAVSSDEGPDKGYATPGRSGRRNRGLGFPKRQSPLI